MKIDSSDYFTLGMSFGVILMGIVVTFGSKTQDMGIEAEKVIAECQKDLPRSQVCELTAKVKEGKE